MIIKIQQPLGGAMDRALVTNVSQSYAVFVDMDLVKHLFADGSLKVYHRAKRDDKKGIATTNVGDDDSVQISLRTGEVTKHQTKREKHLDSIGDNRLVIGKRLHDQSW